MHTAPTRSLAALAALAALGAASASCSYSELTPAIVLQVSGIPWNADHLDVLLTDSGGATFERFPALGPGTLALEVDLPAPASGVFSLTITALDRKDTVAQISGVHGNYQGTLLTLPVALVRNGTTGAYGAPCDSTGGCFSLLDCKKYTPTDTGLCTRACDQASDPCDPAPAGASCAPFNAPTGTAYCQFQCDAQACPNGLVCGRTAMTDGHHYCQGAQ